MNALLVVLLPLATKAPDPADVKPGWLGFGMFLALAVAVLLLWLSMRRQLKKIDFVEEPDPPKDRPTTGSTAGSPTGPASTPGAPAE